MSPRKRSHFKRPCLDCGRPSYFERCEHCAPDHERTRRANEPHRAVYSTAAWRRAREACLIRDGYRCTVSEMTLENTAGVRCHVYDPSGRSLDAHHTRKLSELVAAGENPTDLRWLRTVCKRHHRLLEGLIDQGLSVRAGLSQPERNVATPQLRLVSDKRTDGNSTEAE